MSVLFWFYAVFFCKFLLSRESFYPQKGLRILFLEMLPYGKKQKLSDKLVELTYEFQQYKSLRYKISNNVPCVFWKKSILFRRQFLSHCLWLQLFYLWVENNEGIDYLLGVCLSFFHIFWDGRLLVRSRDQYNWSFSISANSQHTQYLNSYL